LELLRGVMLFARAVLQTPRCNRYWVEVASATSSDIIAGPDGEAVAICSCVVLAP
jgi:hypothetical protein